MSVLTLAAMLAMQTLTSPNDPHWLRLGGDQGGEFSIHAATLTRQGDRVNVQVRIRVHGDNPSLGVLHYEYDCRANTVRNILADVYESGGRFIGTDRNGGGQAQPTTISDGSPNTIVVNHVCPGR